MPWLRNAPWAFCESLKDYNENASLWVAWFEGEKPADLAAFIQQEIERPRRRWKSNPHPL